jgi:hypothetical protein
MSNLNWRCCAKLNRFKRYVKVLIRHKEDNHLVYVGWYNNDLGLNYYHFGVTMPVPDMFIKDYEFVTLGEL